MKYILLTAGITLGIILLIIVVVRAIAGANQTITSPSSSELSISEVPTITPVAIPQSELLTLNDVQQFASGSGSRGIDVASEEVQNSIFEIKKLEALLPYEATIQTSNGKSVQIVIPQREYQDNNRTLLVNIYYIDFNLRPDSPEDLENKVAFQDTVNHITTWLQQQGVDPKKVIFKWGDTAEVQEKTEEWLAN